MSSSTDEVIESRIVELLMVYPSISPTMLQAGLGPSLSPDIWRPVFQNLIEKGVVIQRAELPPMNMRRNRPYSVVELSPARYAPENIKVPPPPAMNARTDNGEAQPQVQTVEAV